MNVVGAGQHVGDIERSNCTLKHGTRCQVHRCPYESYPREMEKGLVQKVTMDDNSLLSNSGILDIYGPATLVCGKGRPDYDDVTATNFGNYCQTDEPVSPTNTQE